MSGFFWFYLASFIMCEILSGVRFSIERYSKDDEFNKKAWIVITFFFIIVFFIVLIINPDSWFD